MRGKASGLVNGTEAVPYDFGIRVATVGELGGFNMEDYFDMSELLLLDEGFDRFVVGATRGAGVGTIDNVHELFANKDGFSEEGPFMEVAIIEQGIRWCFVSHDKVGVGAKKNKQGQEQEQVRSHS